MVPYMDNDPITDDSVFQSSYATNMVIEGLQL